MSNSPILNIPGIENGTADGNTLRWEASTGRWEENTSLVITDAGNVGRGTAAPTAPMHIQDAVTSSGTGTTIALLRLEDTGGNVLEFLTDDDSTSVNCIYFSDSANGAGRILYTHSTDDMTFNTASAERMRITSAGNVGIGTAAPFSKLTVVDSADNMSMTLQNEQAGGNANLNLYAGDGAESALRFRDAADADVGEIVYDHTSNFMAFRANAAERARIDASGNLLVGTTNGNINGERFVAHRGAGTTAAFSTGATTGVTTLIRFYDGAPATVGNIAVNADTNTTVYNTSSDIRLKENIQDAADPFAKINAIQVREFDWKAGGHQDFGFIAQELIAAAPEAVTEGETEDDTWGVDPSKLVPVLVKAIQELTARVEELEA